MPHSLTPRDQLIVALDYPTAAAALALVDALDGQCLWFKVGLELYLAAGAPIVTTLRQRGFNVFLDLKLHDIPNTVASAVRSVSSLGASLLTLHAAGGPAMLAAAAEAASATPDAPTLLAVTVLTSMDNTQLNSIGVPGTPADQVLRLAHMAAAAGVPNLVCSSEELTALRRDLGPSPRLVVPGIRPTGASTDDQQRIATPAAAIAAGASMLVVGRPITKAANPAKAAEAILHEISGL
ncbi:orotidine-5'-phosphate decarboxylase [Granulicella tundricola]|uniref:Orotidine 5'-phosphate decarboxylase n=1 Tax=Granulicella tundricola (strain ATCC BAA-1859 / DSM 23138 / MP5ACTX9) TaxID=1198114 RepID=E8X2L3_GRATM|nr:orotidine-5'-phosphate decarboxylase [Granulicella tundricola]ADW69237.1 orotidine 5'-phosphate decarboxylase [Granulicella tundricola MP5ACTX9]